MAAGDVLVFGLVGAYSGVRGSTFNGRPLPAEVVVTGDSVSLVHRRRAPSELLNDLLPG